MQTAKHLSQNANPAHDFLSIVMRALQKVRRKVEIPDEIQDARTLLDAMPLATSEYSVALNRLNNTARYLASREFGAARWELSMLQNQIRNQE